MNVGSKVCAVVVTFYPDVGLMERLARVLPQVEALTIVDNTPAGTLMWQPDAELLESEKVHLIRNSKNRGVAVALNQGLAQAQKYGCEWLLTLDQDSNCYPNIVQTLLNVKTACEQPPAVIGGNYLDTRNHKTKVAVGEGGEFFNQKTVITSGCLVDVRFAEAIGGFREDYFIDQVDHEFCLRVRRYGGRVVISRTPVMVHSVGEPDGAWLPFLGQLPNHSPLRKYYIARNSIVTIIRYWRSEPSWCVRRATRLVLGFFLMTTLEQQRRIKAKAFMSGISDAIGGRMGIKLKMWL